MADNFDDGSFFDGISLYILNLLIDIDEGVSNTAYGIDP